MGDAIVFGLDYHCSVPGKLLRVVSLYGMLEVVIYTYALAPEVHVKLRMVWNP